MATANAVSPAGKKPVAVSPEPPKRIESVNIDAANCEDWLTPAFSPGEAAKVPGYTTYAVCRSPERRRPLFQHGRAGGGNLKLRFTRDALVSSLFQVETTGGFVLNFEPDAVRASDVDAFAAADWLRHPSTPHLKVTFQALRKWKEEGESSGVLFDPARGGRAAREEALSASFTTLADMEVAAGGKTVRLEDVPVKVKISDRVRYWSIRIDTRFELSPDKADDRATVPVSVKLTHEAFAPAPKSQAPKSHAAESLVELP
jgi:hypothetical protein